MLTRTCDACGGKAEHDNVRIEWYRHHYRETLDLCKGCASPLLEPLKEWRGTCQIGGLLQRCGKALRNILLDK